MAKLYEFNVGFEILVCTSISIKAESLEDAVVRAKELKVVDVIEIPGEHLDSTIKVTGVYE